jgi:hypothetical protein
MPNIKHPSFHICRLVSLMDRDSHGMIYIAKSRVQLHMTYLQTSNSDGENLQNGKSVSEEL